MLVDVAREHAMQALYQLSYSPERSHVSSGDPGPIGHGDTLGHR
jgi:hypothetical protein